MPLDRPRKEEEDEEPEAFWKGLVRDLIVAGIIVAVFLASIYAYTGVWPPLVVVESSSMQHSDRESFLGVIDTGDMVFQQAAPDRASVVTYLQGRASGYTTYGDFGDVIIFRVATSATPVIHRAIMYITLHANRTADVPDILLLPTAEWIARDVNSVPTRNPVYLGSLTIFRMGFERNINLTFDFANLPLGLERSGYVTMGDNNLFGQCRSMRDACDIGYDVRWLALQSDIQGRARGEIPWFGLLKLTLQPTDSCCAGGWGDPEAPKNSWDSLAVSLIVLFAFPFILEYAARGWAKYISPRLPEIPWPWKRRHKADAGKANPENRADGPNVSSKNRPKKPPREESSEL